MGSKPQRQNQHMRKLMKKIERFKKKGISTIGLEKELGYCMGENPRPKFKTGSIADARNRRSRPVED
tara:strand:+ start:11207 stop:11407 length:201 start_codon:yes stop_codon:yes gene_type:complete